MKKKCIRLLMDEASGLGRASPHCRNYFDVLLQFVKREGLAGFDTAEVWAITKVARQRGRLSELDKLVKQRIAGDIGVK